MANNMIYCEIEGNPQNDYWEFAPGVYSIPDRIGYNTKIQRAMSYSTRVWIQGPRGGVRFRDKEHSLFSYITTNEDLMKQFMWVKLKAQPLKHYN